MNLIFNPSILVALSESEKRVIFVILLFLIVALLIVVAIGYVIVKIMKSQARKIENAVYDAVVLRVIKDKKQFKKYAKTKNYQMFIKQAWIPIIFIGVGFLVLLIRNLIYNDFSYNPFSKDNGFLSLLWLWDFKDPANYSTFFGLTLLSKWPSTINTPHFVPEAWGGYAFVPCLVIGCIWYIITVQGFFARAFKIKKLAKSIYDKDLSDFKFDKDKSLEEVMKN